MFALDRERRVGGEMRVVELVALGVAEPQPPAADLVPADRVDGAVCDGEQRRSERREDVLAVVPAADDVGARSAERVAERGRAENGEDEALARELRLDA